MSLFLQWESTVPIILLPHCLLFCPTVLHTGWLQAVWSLEFKQLKGIQQLEVLYIQEGIHIVGGQDWRNFYEWGIVSKWQSIIWLFIGFHQIRKTSIYWVSLPVRCMCSSGCSLQLQGKYSNCIYFMTEKMELRGVSWVQNKAVKKLNPGRLTSGPDLLSRKWCWFLRGDFFLPIFSKKLVNSPQLEQHK